MEILRVQNEDKLVFEKVDFILIQVLEFLVGEDELLTLGFRFLRPVNLDLGHVLVGLRKNVFDFCFEPFRIVGNFRQVQLLDRMRNYFAMLPAVVLLEIKDVLATEENACRLQKLAHLMLVEVLVERSRVGNNNRLGQLIPQKVGVMIVVMFATFVLLGEKTCELFGKALFEFFFDIFFGDQTLFSWRLRLLIIVLRNNLFRINSDSLNNMKVFEVIFHFLDGLDNHELFIFVVRVMVNLDVYD